MEQKEISKTQVVMHLEDEFPLHDRRKEGWKLIGFVEKDEENPKHTKPKNLAKGTDLFVNPKYPYGKVPIWRYLGWDIGKKYTGQRLREIRAGRQKA